MTFPLPATCRKSVQTGDRPACDREIGEIDVQPLGVAGDGNPFRLVNDQIVHIHGPLLGGIFMLNVHE